MVHNFILFSVCMHVCPCCCCCCCCVPRCVGADATMAAVVAIVVKEIEINVCVNASK